MTRVKTKRHRTYGKHLAAALLWLLTPALLAAEAQQHVVRPTLILPEEGAIQNAGTGTEIWRGGPGDGETRLVKYAVRVSDYAVNSMIRVNWSDYEREEGEYLFADMDKYFESCIEYGQKLNVACFVTSANHGLTIDGALCAYPAYVHERMQESEQRDTKYTSSRGNISRWEPNFESPYFFQRYDALLKAFAEYLEEPLVFQGRSIPRKRLVRCIEMRHFGFWGEGAYPRQFVPSDSKYLIQFADAFARHFPDIRLIVPTNGMVFAPSVYDTIKDYHFHLLSVRNKAGMFGIFRDNWGWDERWSYYQRIYYAANKYEKDGVKMYELLRDRWRLAPLLGEPGQTSPKDDFQPYSCLMQQVTYLHPVMIRNCNVSHGNKSYVNPTGYNALEDPQALDQFHRAYALMGFRYLFPSAAISRQDRDLEISIDWLNIGLTPTYDLWQIRFFMEDETGKEIWSGISEFDLRKVFPMEGTVPGVVAPEQATSHKDRFPDVPASGKLFLQIVDPVGISPPMALSIQGRTKQGAYPLGTE